MAAHEGHEEDTKFFQQPMNMNMEKRVCKYCGEGTRCGWYRHKDGGYLCDDCGDVEYELDLSDLEFSEKALEETRIAQSQLVEDLTWEFARWLAETIEKGLQKKLNEIHGREVTVDDLNREDFLIVKDTSGRESYTYRGEVLLIVEPFDENMKRTVRY